MASEKDTAGVRTDVRFATIPEWVYLHPRMTMTALLIYLDLARRADGKGHSFPSRQTIAGDVGRTVKAVSEGLALLREVGAVTSRHEFRDDGSQRANTYTVHRVPPGWTGDSSRVTSSRSQGSPTGDLGGVPQFLPRSTSQGSTSQGSTNKGSPLSVSPRWPEKVGTRRVTETERQMVTDLIAAFNEHAGTRLTPEAHAKPIIGRLRSFPDVGLTEHVAILRARMADPWWKGRPTPSVIWGNDAVFDTARQLLNGTPFPERGQREMPGAAANRRIRAMLDDIDQDEGTA